LPTNARRRAGLRSRRECHGKNIFVCSPLQETTEKIKTFNGEIILPGTVDMWLALAYKLEKERGKR